MDIDDAVDAGASSTGDRHQRPGIYGHDTPLSMTGFGRSELETALLTLFIRHTSASLVIQENADPDVQDDLVDALSAWRRKTGAWRHTTEGPDDMPAHVKAMVTATSLSIPVMDGKMVLGTWQAIYLIEHRTAPHQREIVLHYAGHGRPTQPIVECRRVAEQQARG